MLDSWKQCVASGCDGRFRAPEFMFMLRAGFMAAAAVTHTSVDINRLGTNVWLTGLLKQTLEWSSDFYHQVSDLTQ